MRLGFHHLRFCLHPELCHLLGTYVLTPAVPLGSERCSKISPQQFWGGGDSRPHRAGAHCSAWSGGGGCSLNSKNLPTITHLCQFLCSFSPVGCADDPEGDLNMPPPNMLHKDYFELNIAEKQQVQEKSSALPFST